jgi:hypothetical protein
MFLWIKEEVDTISRFDERHVIDSVCVLREETSPGSTGRDGVVFGVEIARGLITFVDVEPGVIDAICVPKAGIEMLFAKDEVIGMSGFRNTKSRANIYKEEVLFAIGIYFTFAICPEDIFDIGGLVDEVIVRIVLLPKRISREGRVWNKFCRRSIQIGDRKRMLIPLFQKEGKSNKKYSCESSREKDLRCLGVGGGIHD